MENVTETKTRRKGASKSVTSKSGDSNGKSAKKNGMTVKKENTLRALGFIK